MTSLSLSRSLPLLEEATVRGLLSYDELIPALQEAFVQFSAGRIVQPVRCVLPVDKYEGFSAFMPAYSPQSDAMAAKVVSYFPNNAAKGLATHGSYVMVFHPETGALRAMMDGDVITNMRTAAASAIASKFLAKPDSKVLAVLGAGVQAKSHIEALSKLFEFEQVKIWSRSSASAQKLAAEGKGQACSTVEEATQGADIICTCTGARQPVLMSRNVKEGAHINAVGACRPTWQELESDLMCRAVVVVDSRAGCLSDSGDLIISKAEVTAELGEVISGKVEVDRNKTTVFDSVGMATEDLVSAEIIYKKYVASLEK